MVRNQNASYKQDIGTYKLRLGLTFTSVRVARYNHETIGCKSVGALLQNFGIFDCRRDRPTHRRAHDRYVVTRTNTRGHTPARTHHLAPAQPRDRAPPWRFQMESDYRPIQWRRPLRQRSRTSRLPLRSPRGCRLASSQPPSTAEHQGTRSWRQQTGTWTARALGCAQSSRWLVNSPPGPTLVQWQAEGTSSTQRTFGSLLRHRSVEEVRVVQFSWLVSARYDLYESYGLPNVVIRELSSFSKGPLLRRALSAVESWRLVRLV